MNSHTRRLALGALIAFLVLTALFLLLPKTALVIAGYCFGLLAVAALSVTLLQISGGTRKQYLLNAAYPLLAWGYLAGNIGCSVLFIALAQSKVWSIPLGWFIFLHIILLAVFAWRLLAMDSGREIIEAVEKNVKVKTCGWKLLVADADELLSRTPAEYRTAVSGVRDALRYSDPMCEDSLRELEEAIAGEVRQLDEAVRSGESERVQNLSEELLRRIKDRNNRLKLLK